ncbi:MAG TPA: PxKF domain-containing protein [Gaiellaceae bacterium]|nr:PxKF domain-containing protein [Gaiellaceae bacterium]
MVAVAAIGALAVTGAGVSAPAASRDTGPAAAPILPGAEAGGHVIVWFKNQHSNFNLRTQFAQRRAAADADQAPVISDMRSNGGSDVQQLVSVNAVAADLSAAEVQRLARNPNVEQIVPDSEVDVGEILGSSPATSVASSGPPSSNPAQCGTQANPLVEPEALSDIRASSTDPTQADEANSIATGKGVIVANDGINNLAGNPNFTRSDGTHVVIGATDYTKDVSDGEYYGDASSIAAQGTVEYDYGKELPYSGYPVGQCYFILRGDAPDASLVDITNNDLPESVSSDGTMRVESESDIVAGIDAAVGKYHADVLSESYGYGLTPGSYVTHYAANDAAVAAGVTVVVSSGDSGVQGTVSSPASDPLVIAVGATNTLRENAMAYGYTGWVNDNITPLSSGGTTPDNKDVDLVAPGYGGEAACNPHGTDCPTNTATEAFGGTSQAAPLVSGAVADVIQAYRDTHGGSSPSPALIKQILVSTATDIGAPADQEGAGLVDIYAAVRAAQQMPGSSDGQGPGDAPSLIASTTSADSSQIEVTGDGGSSIGQSVSLYNTSDQPTTVTGTFREESPWQQFGSSVTENVSAPDPSLPLPAKGADAAAPITFQVPAGLDQMQAEMIWPDATNGNVLSFVLTDPEGRLVQQSYDYGTASTRPGRLGTVPNIQQVQVSHPEPGTWTAEILWANGRSHLQEPPNIPTSYTGPLTFRTLGATYSSTPASSAVTIGAHSSATIPLQIAMPQAPGDHPESVQFTADDGATANVPVARRTLIPAAGGPFTAVMTNTVGRGQGQITTFDYPVAAGMSNLTVTFSEPDASPSNVYTFYLVRPDTHRAATSATGQVTTVNGVSTITAKLQVANPVPGDWEIDVRLGVTESGQEFQQVVTGNVVLPPTVSYTLSPAAPNGQNGWYTSPVTVHWTVTNPGTSSGCDDTTVSADGVTSLTCSTTNAAGTASATATVKVDQTSPTTTATLSPAIRNGWYASPTLTLTGADGSGSGVDHIDYSLDGGASHVYSGPISGFSTGNHFVQYHATDVAGNVEATKLIAFKVDAAAPTVNVTRPTDGDSFPLGKVVTAAYKCSDKDSGIDTCTGTVPDGSDLDTSTVGDHTFTVTGTDKAGNVTTVTHHYEVVYTWQGFFSPITNSGDGVNLVHAGDLIKIGFGLNGDRGLNVFADGYPTSEQITCPSGTPHSVPAGGAGTTAGLSYGVASGHYAFGWQTDPSWAGTCRQFQIVLNDGTSTVHSADFMFFP